MLGHDVTLSQLRKLMTRSSVSATTAAATPSSSAPYLSNPSLALSTTCTSSETLTYPPLKISIHQSEDSSSLPQVKVTLKQEPNKEAMQRLRSTFKSPSWAPDMNTEWRSYRAVERENSVRELLGRDDDVIMNSSSRVERHVTRYAKNRAGQLSGLARQPRMEMVREWVHASPLDTPPSEESQLMKQLRRQKPSRRVRFGKNETAGQWMYGKDTFTSQ